MPIITPFADDGTVATEALERLAGRLIDDGAAGLVALGTAGEGPLLDDGERQAVLEVCARVCSDRGAQLIVGAGSNSTSHTMAAVRALDGTIGLTAVLCLVPYYLRPTQAGIRAHFEAVADASPVPVVIYNIPFRTGIRPSLETLLALAALEGVAGMKHSVGALDEDTQQLLAAAPEDFAILGGDDQHLAALVLLASRPPRTSLLLVGSRLPTRHSTAAWRRLGSISRRSYPWQRPASPSQVPLCSREFSTAAAKYRPRMCAFRSCRQ